MEDEVAHGEGVSEEGCWVDFGGHCCLLVWSSLFGDDDGEGFDDRGGGHRGFCIVDDH